jgi:hypothetical protein
MRIFKNRDAEEDILAEERQGNGAVGDCIVRSFMICTSH